MAIQNSGTITIQDIADEFGGTTPHSLSEYYDAASGIPASGTISLSDFYGATSTVSKSFSFYESRNGSNIGTMNVYILDTSGNVLDGPVYTTSGQLGDRNWYQRNVNYTIPPEDHRIAFHYVSGNGTYGDYSIDSVSQNSVMIGDFEGGGGWITTSSVDTSDSVTAYNNTVSLPNSTSAVLGRWNKTSGETPSSSWFDYTGPAGAQSGTYYAYAETNSPNSSGQNMWLMSPVLYGDPLVTTFYEHRYGPNIGSVDVYIVDSTNGAIIQGPIYSASGALDTNWHQRTATSSKPTQNYRLAFHYVSGSNYYGDYAIDNVVVGGTLIGDDFYNEGWLASSSNTTSSTTAFSNTSTITQNSSTQGIWNSYSGSTPSGSTGPTSAQTGTYYAYTEVTNSFGVNMWLFSPEITP